MLYFSTDGCINKSLTYLLTYLLTLGLVTTWMGDHLLIGTGKQSQYIPNYLSQTQPSILHG